MIPNEIVCNKFNHSMWNCTVNDYFHLRYYEIHNMSLSCNIPKVDYAIRENDCYISFCVYKKPVDMSQFNFNIGSFIGMILIGFVFMPAMFCL